MAKITYFCCLSIPDPSKLDLVISRRFSGFYWVKSLVLIKHSRVRTDPKHTLFWPCTKQICSRSGFLHAFTTSCPRSIAVLKQTRCLISPLSCSTKLTRADVDPTPRFVYLLLQTFMCNVRGAHMPQS